MLRAEARELREKARSVSDPIVASKMFELAAELERKATAKDGKTPNGHT